MALRARRRNQASGRQAPPRAREHGDLVATRILDRAADELAQGARSVAARLDMQDAEFTFVLAGSIFRVVPSLGSQLARQLAEVAPRSRLLLLEEEPAAGAVSLALEEARGGAAIPKYR